MGIDPGGIRWTDHGRAVPTTAPQTGAPVRLNEVTAPVIPPPNATIVIVAVQKTGGTPAIERVAGPLIVNVWGAGLIWAWEALGAPAATRATASAAAARLNFDMTQSF